MPAPGAAVAAFPGLPAFGEWWERPAPKDFVVEAFHSVFAEELFKLVGNALSL
jgi:hypothetical protein